MTNRALAFRHVHRGVNNMYGIRRRDLPKDVTPEALQLRLNALRTSKGSQAVLREARARRRRGEE